MGDPEIKMAEDAARDAHSPSEDEKLNGSTMKPQEPEAKPAQKDSMFTKIKKKADLNPPTIMLMLK